MGGGYANAVLLFALNAPAPSSTFESGVAGLRASQLCWLAALVARRQAPRTPVTGNGSP